MLLSRRSGGVGTWYIYRGRGHTIIMSLLLFSFLVNLTRRGGFDRDIRKLGLSLSMKALAFSFK